MDTVFVPSRVTDALFFVALVGVTLTFKAIWTAWAIKATVWWSRLIRTQRARYVEVVLAEVLAASDQGRHAAVVGGRHHR